MPIVWRPWAGVPRGFDAELGERHEERYDFDPGVGPGQDPVAVTDASAAQPPRELVPACVQFGMGQRDVVE